MSRGLDCLLGFEMFLYILDAGLVQSCQFFGSLASFGKRHRAFAAIAAVSSDRNSLPIEVGFLRIE